MIPAVIKRWKIIDREGLSLFIAFINNADAQLKESLARRYAATANHCDITSAAQTQGRPDGKNDAYFRKENGK